MKRITFKLAMLLVLGAIINIAVAWGCSLWSPLTSEVEMSQQELSEHAIHDGLDPNELSWMMGSMSSSFGLTAFDHTYFSKRMLGTPAFGSNPPYEYESGWPLRSLFCIYMPFGIKAKHGFFPPHCLQSGERAIPYLPIWPGFAINTIFYAGVLWLLFAAPGFVRRRYRIKRGLCPSCAYPVGVSKVCAECGAQVPSPSRGSA